MRRRGLCGSGLIAEASAAVSRARVSTICWSISTCHVLGFFGGAVPDYSAAFSLPMPDAETSISEEPGARKGHAGICAGAVRATGRPTAMVHERWSRDCTLQIAAGAFRRVSAGPNELWIRRSLEDRRQFFVSRIPAHDGEWSSCGVNSARKESITSFRSEPAYRASRRYRARHSGRGYCDFRLPKG